MQSIRAIVFAVAFAAAAWLAGIGPAAAAEAKLKAVSAFPKSHPFTISFLKYIDLVNTGAKGVLSIEFIGGPEVTPPARQPVALRNGLFDLLYGPPAYYLGIFPEGDAFDGFKMPAETRKVNGFAYIDTAIREKLGATFVGRFDAGGGLYLFLTKEPKLSQAGNIDLTGLKIRSSPAYGDFLQALGGAAVVMPITEIYTALERGVVDGAATGLSGLRESGLPKFLKYRIEPNFSVTSTILIANAQKIDGLPADARKKLYDIALAYEDVSMKATIADEKKQKEDLAKDGQKAFELKGAAAERFVETYMRYPWQRLAQNPAVKLDVNRLREALR
jgi:TRAP-type C4-dicarboxylate transport system substrate-binding protein